MKKHFIILLFFAICMSSVQSQNIGLGATCGIDLYQFKLRPVEDNFDFKSRSSGSAILNFFVGPKVYFGGDFMSISFEASANWSIFHLDLNEYKGLGAFSFPVLARLNFGALSGFNTDRVFGYSLAGGLQWNNTEIYGIKDEFKNSNTGYFRTLVFEASFGLGVVGTDSQFFIRFGYGDHSSITLNTGLVFNVNFIRIGQQAREMRKARKRGEVIKRT